MDGSEHSQWMRRALELAKKGWGRTSPNPMVGAVVVKDGVCVGEGWHRKAGGPHAEVHALNDAGAESAGATIYVTLEPCSTHGRTPPCTQAVIDAGISTVVVGCCDPNPKHAGAAESILQRAGIQTTTGVLEDACRDLNEAFFWWIQKKRPFVLLKMAMTLDGKIATAAGQSQWITGPPARRKVQRLRQWADAIMVGGETVRRDDPSLTVRSPQRWEKQPLPCVWTGGDVPANAKLCRGGEVMPVVAKPQTADEWVSFLRELGEREVTALLLEGGGELAASALQAGIVNKVAFFVAPKILGGRSSRPVVGGVDPDTLAEAMTLDGVRTQRVGEDLLITGYCTDVYGID